MNTKASIIALGLSLSAAILCTSCAESKKIKEKIAEDIALLKGGKEANPVPVKVLEINASEVFGTTGYAGKAEPAKTAVILNQYPGTAEEVCAREGRRIEKGDIIAKIGSETVKSAYDIAKSTLAQAEDAYARVSKVYESGSITEIKIVEVRTQLEKARAAEKSARKALEDCSVKAPFSGVIGDVYIHNGEHVSAAAPIAQILDTKNVEIHFSVPESEYSAIALGAKAKVEVPALGKDFEGSVAVKGLNASPLSHSYDFTLKGISGEGDIMPGMVCKVRIQDSDSNCIVIPASAVMTDFDGRYIWGVGDDARVCKTYVTLGGYAGKGVIVKEGLKEGDKVIVEGSRKVSTGMKVSWK